ncbi:hypothetical protein CR513_44975, partial [Mucuna pruriens]
MNQPDSQPQKDWKFVTHHPQDLILSEKTKEIKLKEIEKALKEGDWFIVMEEKLYQFTRNDVWALVPKIDHKASLEIDGFFCNKLDKDGKMVKFQFEDYSSFEQNIPVFYDNANAINLSKILTQHKK